AISPGPWSGSSAAPPRIWNAWGRTGLESDAVCAAPARPVGPRRMFQGLSHAAREAKAWPFEQARVLLERILRLRLDDAERHLDSGLLLQGKADEAAQTFPALNRPVVFQCGYGASGLPHMGTFGEAARPTMVRGAFRALTGDAIPTRLIVFSDDMDGLRK